MKAVILAAGKGSRIGFLTESPNVLQRVIKRSSKMKKAPLNAMLALLQTAEAKKTHSISSTVRAKFWLPYVLWLLFQNTIGICTEKPKRIET